jgi:hypothetical protein
VGGVEADGKEEEKRRKKDTEDAKNENGDWLREKNWWLLGGEFWNQAERKKRVDWSGTDCERA